MSVESDVLRTLKTAVASQYSKLALEKWQQLVHSQDMDWLALANLSNTKGLTPLLYNGVRGTSGLKIPTEIERLLKQSYHAAATFNLLALHELTIVLDSLTLAQIPVVVLKGAALLLSAYDNFALRPMVDLDLLIQFAHLEQTVESLANIGYQEQQPAPFTNYQGLFWNEMLLVSSGPTKMQLEIHWNLLDNPYYAMKLKTETLIARSRLKADAEKNLLLLAPDDQILHLCIHNTYHHQSLLERSFVDIAFVANHYADEIDWDRLVKTAIDNDMACAVAKNLSLAATEWYATIPPEILKRLEKPGIDIRERYFILSQRSEFLKLARTLITVPGMKPKLYFILGQLFPSRAYLVWRYGKRKTEPTIVLYLKRYTSGLIGLIVELAGRPSRLKGRRKQTKTPG